jgi:Zn-dependent protease
MPHPELRRSGWSWRVGRIAGIDLYVHATFVILLGWVALSHMMRGQNASEVLAGVAVMVAVFAFVVLHELGHALVARRFAFEPETSRSSRSVAWLEWNACPTVLEDALRAFSMIFPLPKTVESSAFFVGSTFFGALRRTQRGSGWEIA